MSSNALKLSKKIQFLWELNQEAKKMDDWCKFQELSVDHFVLQGFLKKTFFLHFSRILGVGGHQLVWVFVTYVFTSTLLSNNNNNNDNS